MSSSIRLRRSRTFAKYAEYAKYFRLAIATTALCFSASANAANAANAASTQSAIDVYRAKSIITMDSRFPRAKLVAVRDGIILGVGNNLAQLHPWLKDADYRIDDTFSDHVLMPGFIDPHQHLLIGPLALRQHLVTYNDVHHPDGSIVPGVRTREAALEKLRQIDKTLPTGEVLFAWGFDVLAHGGDLTIAELDSVSTKRPILVWDSSIHNVYLNNKAVATYRHILPADFADRFPDSDVDKGLFIGGAAAFHMLLPQLTSALTPGGVQQTLQYSIDNLHRGGITTTADLLFGALNPKLEEFALPAVLNRPDTPLRSVMVLSGTTYKLPDLARLQKTETDKVIYSGVKFFMDDAFLTLTMRGGSPGYIGRPDGVWQSEQDALFQQILPWWRAGERVHVHSNGHEAQQATLRLLERLHNDKPRFDHRFTFEHVGMLDESQALRMKELGAQASVNTWYPYLRSALNVPYLGYDRASTVAPVSILMDAGVRTTFHTDVPIAPPRPLGSVWNVTTRLDQDNRTVWGKAVRIDIDRALKAITIDAARVLQVEDRVGSIQAGKFADFTVLASDPYRTKAKRVRDIEIWGTVVGGRLFPLSEINGK